MASLSQSERPVAAYLSQQAYQPDVMDGSSLGKNLHCAGATHVALPNAACAGASWIGGTACIILPSVSSAALLSQELLNHEHNTNRANPRHQRRADRARIHWLRPGRHRLEFL